MAIINKEDKTSEFPSPGGLGVSREVIQKVQTLYYTKNAVHTSGPKGPFRTKNTTESEFRYGE